MTKEEQTAERIGALVGTYGTDEEIEFFKKFLDAYKKTVDLYTNLKQVEKEHQEENGKLRVELEQYKRLAEMNLKDAENFKKNMCQHRCILYNEIEELKTELFEEKEKNKELFEQNQIYALEGDKINLERHIKNNYIRKDKVQEKIKEYDGLKIIDKQAYEEQIKPLKELWEDNNG